MSRFLTLLFATTVFMAGCVKSEKIASDPFEGHYPDEIIVTAEKDPAYCDGNGYIVHAIFLHQHDMRPALMVNSGDTGNFLFTRDYGHGTDNHMIYETKIEVSLPEDPINMDTMATVTLTANDEIIEENVIPVFVHHGKKV